MKLYRFFICLVFLGLLAGATYSQTDPKVILSDPAVSNSCTPNVNSTGCYNGQQPFTLTFQSPLQTGLFVYDGTSPLKEFVLVFTMVPDGTFFECESDIFSKCGTKASLETGGVFTEEIDFFGDPLGVPKTCDGNPNGCVNELFQNDGFGVTVQPVLADAPEPASMLLFGTGLCSILLAAKRRLIRPAVTV
jgi:hypothetical protein